MVLRDLGQLADRSDPHKMTWWEYDTIPVDDPDGNELYFPVDDAP